ncbi:MAG: 16S rRNA (guanine(966)-N(2))-methyltransferase [uncultured Nocardioidaceae bacterium]|uniref:16S rRNA (Guanine(966)-N(2))-methyltransferase n=1 Tax=uncultured Nocardioidaceae bacterium TaxID=253824 RepID=A0A6J4NJT3_9ACTN|nr:MAG: 16S rRNA (guanine(966)-N(2))-methyltransferase [uncultured Nocardioidaceae bacterium]
MTRIIGGSAGGRRLQTPKGDLTRPTSDRVREALFSAVQSSLGPLDGLRFLDLYAGSGAVGLEAMSRGAAAVTLVEHDRRTAGLIRTNARTIGFPGVDVVTGSVARHLAEQPAAAYDVVFLDPPYSLTSKAVAADLAALATNGWLTEEALVVVERSSRERLPPWPAGYVEGRERRYGETTLSFATWSGAGEAACYGRDESATEPPTSHG